MTDYPVLFTLLVLALGGALWVRHRRQSEDSTELRPSPAPRGRKNEAPPERRLDALDTVAAWPPTVTRVLSSPELRVMTLLREALPDHMILAQVQLSRFLRVPERYSYNDWMRRVGHVSVDFLVCDRKANVVAAIELRDNEAAETEKARRRHARMDRVLAAAGIKVYVWRHSSLPLLADTRELILGQAPSSALVNGSAAPEDSVTRAIPPIPPRPRDTGPGILGLPVGETVDELVEMHDPPASTWFDDLPPTAPAPLGPPTRH